MNKVLIIPAGYGQINIIKYFKNKIDLIIIIN